MWGFFPPLSGVNEIRLGQDDVNNHSTNHLCLCRTRFFVQIFLYPSLNSYQLPYLVRALTDAAALTASFCCKP